MVEYVNFEPSKYGVLDPTNDPQPINIFWGCLVQIVYEKGWEATVEELLIHCIKSELRKIDLNSLQTIMADVKRKLRSIRDDNLFS